MLIPEEDNTILIQHLEEEHEDEIQMENIKKREKSYMDQALESMV